MKRIQRHIQVLDYLLRRRLGSISGRFGKYRLQARAPAEVRDISDPSEHLVTRLFLTRPQNSIWRLTRSGSKYTIRVWNIWAKGYYNYFSSFLTFSLSIQSTTHNALPTTHPRNLAILKKVGYRQNNANLYWLLETNTSNFSIPLGYICMYYIVQLTKTLIY